MQLPVVVALLGGEPVQLGTAPTGRCSAGRLYNVITSKATAGIVTSTAAHRSGPGWPFLHQGVGPSTTRSSAASSPAATASASSGAPTPERLPRGTSLPHSAKPPAHCPHWPRNSCTTRPPARSTAGSRMCRRPWTGWRPTMPPAPRLTASTGSPSPSAGGGRFTLRPSNTGPPLRLSVEASDESRMTRVREDVLALLGSWQSGPAPAAARETIHRD